MGGSSIFVEIVWQTVKVSVYFKENKNSKYDKIRKYT